MGRRIQKQVYAWDAASDFWSLTSDLRYVYDGWNLIEVLDATDSNAAVKDFTWGLDLSQSLQGAGGVGGLLAVTDQSGTGSSAYYVTYDANGNVSEYIDSSGNIIAHYEYSPFGKLTATDGSMAADFNHRFSTKFFDTETNLYYYGFRYYSNGLGRWCSRDPDGKKKALYPYCSFRNSPTTGHDPRGLTFETFEENAIAPDSKLADKYRKRGTGGKCEVNYKIKMKCNEQIKIIWKVDGYINYINGKDAEDTLQHERRHKKFAKTVHDEVESVVSAYQNMENKCGCCNAVGRYLRVVRDLKRHLKEIKDADLDYSACKRRGLKKRAKDLLRKKDKLKNMTSQLREKTNELYRKLQSKCF